MRTPYYHYNCTRLNDTVVRVLKTPDGSTRHIVLNIKVVHHWWRYGLVVRHSPVRVEDLGSILYCVQPIVFFKWLQVILCSSQCKRNKGHYFSF